MIPPVIPDGTALLASTPLGSESAGLRGREPREVAREFEAMLLAQMIAAMRKTVPESGLLGASAHRQVLDGVFDLELARALGEDGGLGLADVLARQLGLDPGVDRAGSRDTARPSPAAPETGASFTPTDPAAALSSEMGSPPDVLLPVAGRLSSPYGPRIHPLTGREHFHGGIDVAAPRGASVASPRPGEVVEVGSGGAAGRFVRIRHADATVSTYAHLDSVRVQPGERVAAGQQVATVGMTGRTTGPHLHLSVHREGVPIDPSVWLGQVEGALG